MLPIFLKDGYKASHRPQYPEGTEVVYSNFTPRSNKHGIADKVVVFGIQAFIKKYLIDDFNNNFFNEPKEKVLLEYKAIMDEYLFCDYDVSHIGELHDLGYLPLIIKALPEGSKVKMGIPVLTIYNTHPRFFWLTNFLETLISCELWLPMTSATTANVYREIFTQYAELTGGDKGFIPFQGHDFSMRGMGGVGASLLSGMAHLTSFAGTDTIPAIIEAKKYYNATGLVGCSVPACYDSETENLTENGFIKFELLSKTDRVAQYNIDGSVDFVIPSNHYNMPYKGKMIKWGKEGCGYVDLLVTPNHKMVRINKETNKLDLFEAGDFSYKNRNGYSQRSYLPVSGYVYSKDGDKLTSMERLRVAFQADGSLPNRSESYKSGQIRFSLKKQRKIDRLTEILDKTELKYSKSQVDERGYTSFWVVTNDNNFDKNFSWVSLDSSKEWMDDFINELQYWDGCVKNNCIVYSNTNIQAINRVQEICALSGYKSHFNEYQDNREDYNRLPIFSLCIQDKDKIFGENITRELVDYEGSVHCVSVPSKMVIVRRNNIVSVCGNTEHSVMSLGSKESEQETFRRLIEDIYPSGIVSIVSDTWDLWTVLTKYLPNLRDKVMARNGKVVIRPDSGNPVDIICGLKDKLIEGSEIEGRPSNAEARNKGVVELLWETFGGTVNEKGYKVLDPHIGVIYGDSITIKIAKDILEGLKDKGFASTNIVFGIGSFTYTYVSRDTYGFAMKATWGKVNGEAREIFKDPITDNGLKKSAKGLLRVDLVDGEYKLKDQCTKEEEQGGCLKVVFDNGFLEGQTTLQEIRERLCK